MSKVFFISDLHFGHKNLEQLRKIPVEKTDEMIITNWNNTISKKDLVYLLGDITMESPKLVKHYLEQLKGTIRVIGGNHDSRKVCEVLQELNIVVMGCLKYNGFICTHIPVHPMEVSLFRGNIHGHVHTSKVDYGPKYFNVCCELINYTPIEATELEKRFILKNKD